MIESCRHGQVALAISSRLRLRVEDAMDNLVDFGTQVPVEDRHCDLRKPTQLKLGQIDGLFVKRHHDSRGIILSKAFHQQDVILLLNLEVNRRGLLRL